VEKVRHGPTPASGLSSNNKRRHTISATTSSSKKHAKVAGGGKSQRATSKSSTSAGAGKRRSDGTQTSLSFDPKEKYSIGIKLLLSDSIYGGLDKVSKNTTLFVFFER
jgi:hypothetical protein